MDGEVETCESLREEYEKQQKMKVKFLPYFSFVVFVCDFFVSSFLILTFHHQTYNKASNHFNM